MSALSELYGKDYTAWTKQTAELLKAGRFSELDVDHLLEELEGMGASEQRELVNRLRILLAHLLKWQYQYKQLSERWQEFDGRSWRATIVEQRDGIQTLLEDYPGTKRFLADSTVSGYHHARRLAAKETRLPISTFPETCPYSQAQILDDDFYPPMEGE
jgi:hypothetical protein